MSTNDAIREDELRQLVRASIARVLGHDAHGPAGAAGAGVTGHASHGRYAVASSEGPCLIEPAVTCNHCGYCQSHGH